MNALLGAHWLADSTIFHLVTLVADTHIRFAAVLIEGAGLTIWPAACAGLSAVALNALTFVGSCTVLKLPAGF